MTFFMYFSLPLMQNYLDVPVLCAYGVLKRLRQVAIMNDKSLQNFLFVAHAKEEEKIKKPSRQQTTIFSCFFAQLFHSTRQFQLHRPSRHELFPEYLLTQRPAYRNSSKETETEMCVHTYTVKSSKESTTVHIKNIAQNQSEKNIKKYL